MTLTKLKTHTNAILTGDIQAPENVVYIPLLMQALQDVANNVYCLSLVTKSADARVLRSLGDGYYIRMPKEPRIDTDKIDMDEELMFALSNMVASYISQNKPQYFDQKAKEIISSYEFKMLYTETEDLECLE